MLANIPGMSHNSTLPIPALLGRANLEATGLSDAQEVACYAALEAFLKRNRLADWGLQVNLGKDSRLDVSVVASSEFDYQARSSQFTIDKTLNLAEVVDLCLETHYNACMNTKAMSHRERMLM